jgi:hypothetical protein
MAEYTDDQRISPRISVDLDAEIIKSGERLSGSVLNCSLSGIFLRTTEKLEDSEVVEVRILLPGQSEPIVTRSRVIWTDWNERKEMPGFGMHFLSLTDEQALLLRKFLYE